VKFALVAGGVAMAFRAWQLWPAYKASVGASSSSYDTNRAISDTVTASAKWGALGALAGVLASKVV
jgi:hypothetical protein